MAPIRYATRHNISSATIILEIIRFVKSDGDHRVAHLNKDGDAGIRRWTMDLDEFEAVFRERTRFGPHTIRSPIRYEVWRDFALAPAAPLDLLLEAHDTASCTGVALAVLEALETTDVSTTSAQLALADQFVAVRVTFVELLRALVPLTNWWAYVAVIAQIEARELIRHLQAAASDELSPVPAIVVRNAELVPAERVEEFRWFARLAGHIVSDVSRQSRTIATKDASTKLAQRLRRVIKEPFLSTAKPVASISVNRIAHTSVDRSRNTIKADAAARLFDIDAANIGWAVLDSGIDARHEAFRVHDSVTSAPYDEAFMRTPMRWLNRTRVKATYDLIKARSRLGVSSKVDLQGFNVGERIDRDCIIPMDDKYLPPHDVHGTHVAGILAANWTHTKSTTPGAAWMPNPDPLMGVSPTLTLWDFRVLGDDGRGDEFAILTALNHVMRINADHGRIVIHGVNLSLSIPHDVANYACGWTPICEACNRLVDSGVVVVAAAGNTGFRGGAGRAVAGGGPGRRLADGTSYLPISITDPGNASNVITVGATHRELPYRYGVSYFSARGPTADGRCKPDLLAPGEGIFGPVGTNDRMQLDGTSQAAPHVSGAAALLLARYPELAGQPARVKAVLCDSASDLGRDPAFQGHGLVDILRALQTI